MWRALPTSAKPSKPGGGGGGGSAIVGTYAGATYEAYLVFEVHADGSVTGTAEIADYGPDWPDSYLAEYLLWSSLSGNVSGKEVTLDLEFHYDFPDDLDVL